MTRVQFHYLCLTENPTLTTDSVQSKFYTATFKTPTAVLLNTRIFINDAVKSAYGLNKVKNEQGPESFFENYSFFRELCNSPQFTEDEDKFQWSREPITCISPQPDRYGPRLPIPKMYYAFWYYPTPILNSFKQFNSSSLTHENPADSYLLPPLCYMTHLPNHAIVDQSKNLGKTKLWSFSLCSFL